MLRPSNRQQYISISCVRVIGTLVTGPVPVCTRRTNGSAQTPDRSGDTWRGRVGRGAVPSFRRYCGAWIPRIAIGCPKKKIRCASCVWAWCVQLSAESRLSRSITPIETSSFQERASRNEDAEKSRGTGGACARVVVRRRRSSSARTEDAYSLYPLTTN